MQSGAPRRADSYYYDGAGMFVRVGDRPRVTDMLSPVRCLSCRHVFDEAKAESVARYSDCDVYKCPGCKRTVDNRPEGWGGGVRRLDRDGRDAR